MSIDALTGKPGAGKSYHGVKLCVDAVRSGRVVVTNLPLSPQHPEWVEAEQKGLLFRREPTHVGDGPGMHFGCMEGWEGLLDHPNPYIRSVNVGSEKKPKMSEIGPLIVVDEAGSTFMEIQGNAKRKDEWARMVEKMRVHRHSKADVLLLMQDHGQAPPQIKALINHWHRVFNRREIFGGIWSSIFGKPYLVSTHSKGFGGNDTPISTKRGTFKDDVFKLYDSFALGGASGGGDIESSSGKMRTGSMFTKWWMWALILSILLLPVFGWRMFSSMSGVFRGEKGVSFGSDREQPEEIPSELDTSAANGYVAPQIVDMSRPANGLLPPIGTAFVGFDGVFLFFVNGQRTRLFELQENGFVIVQANACSVEIQSAPGRTPVQVFNYRCSRGY